MILLPLGLKGMFFRQPTTVWAVLFLQSAAMALLFAVRRRTATYIRTRLGVNPATVSAILNTPTCRVSFWRRAPMTSLFVDQPKRPSRVGGESEEAVTRQLADRRSSEGPTLGS
jgi:hypothetical protein